MATHLTGTVVCWLYVVSTLVSPSLQDDFHLLLMHTNDVHARVEQFASQGGACKPEMDDAGECVGGVARRHTLIQQLRNDFANSLLLDAGDQFQGTLWFQYYNGTEAKHFMTRLGYDVMTLGNHEFDNGVTGLVPFLTNATFPILAANIDMTNEPRMQNLVQPSVELTVGGETIGIVGYITQETSYLVPPSGIKTIKFTDEVVAVRNEVNAMRERGINKIIALGHAGFEMDKRIAAEVEGVDVVIGGHSNTFLFTGTPPSSEVPASGYPTVVQQDGGGEALVVQAYAYGKYLGVLGVTFDAAGVIKSYTGMPELLDSTIEQDLSILAEVNLWAVPINELGGEIVGETRVLLNGDRTQCRLQECNLGNLMTDAMVEHYLPETPGVDWTNASIAVWNGGGIRDSIAQGEIKMEDLYRVWPFGNEIEMVRMHGSTLRAMLEHGVEIYNPDDAKGAFLQMSGLMVTYDIGLPAGQRVVEAWTRCARCDVPQYSPLKDDALYDILTSAFLVEGGDGYTMIPEDILLRLPYGDTLPPIITQYLKGRPPITQGLERRIIVKDSSTEPDISTAEPDISTTEVDNSAHTAEAKMWTVIGSLILCIALLK